MKKKIYLKPSSNVIRLNIKGQILGNNLGNHSLPHVGDEGDYSGDQQGAKRYTLPDEEEGWDTFPKSNSPWDD